MEEIKATANHSKRTFTIRKNGSKYRTCKLSKDEFEDNLYNTSNDWQNFLSTTNNYYLVSAK